MMFFNMAIPIMNKVKEWIDIEVETRCKDCKVEDFDINLIMFQNLKEIYSELKNDDIYHVKIIKYTQIKIVEKFIETCKNADSDWMKSEKFKEKI